MKQVIDILFIVFPAMIVCFGLIRLFREKTRYLNGLTMLLAILLLLLGLARYFLFPANGGSSHHGPAPEPLQLSQRTERLSARVEAVLRAYFRVGEAFVQGDTVAVHRVCGELSTSLDSLPMEDIRGDSLLYASAGEPLQNIRAEISSILQDPALQEKKASFNILSDNLRSFLSVVQYNGGKLYWMEAEDAFGEGRPGNWISPSEQVQNPYHNGANRAKGSVQSVLQFAPPDTTGS